MSITNKVADKEMLKVNNNTSNLSNTTIESKFDEIKIGIVNKIDKELIDSQNARLFIIQKYDELCNKINFLTELDSTFNGFRRDVKSIEQQVCELSQRVDSIEKRIICKECPSLTSAAF
ncbi:uncharacterized protein LOC114241456 [Bombyx mandarina]|uniref:Uncharacterized protein n=2 Tax=Bombyx TaxID=7090 RepID=A0A8R2AQK0_BOMMO|nr:uncharacterized protein LOC101736862 [Bombyx mori]XP_028028079.1 uncharacterized protein LOC114241456 [Bombyx mandarina]